MVNLIPIKTIEFIGSLANDRYCHFCVLAPGGVLVENIHWGHAGYARPFSPHH